MNILNSTPYLSGVFTSSYGGGSRMIQLKLNQPGRDAGEQWNDKSQASMFSPVTLVTYIFLHLRNQRMTRLDLDSDEEQWTSDTKFRKYVSMVRQDDRILALDQKGILFLIAANPKSDVELDSFKVSKQETWAHLAGRGTELAVRELRGVTLFQINNGTTLSTL
jgi:outer membrane protein assembly factor BamB